MTYVDIELIETALFTKQVGAIISDEEYRALQFQLIVRPAAKRIFLAGD